MNEFNGLQVGRRCTVARRPGTVNGLRLESSGPMVHVVYDDGYTQWIPLAYVLPL